MSRKRARTRPRRRRAYWVGPVLMIVAVTTALGTILLFSKEPSVECTKLEGARGRKSFTAPPCTIIDAKHTYVATLDTSAGPINLVMQPRLGLKSVNNFIFLARAGFYDKTTFHRVDVVKDADQSKDHALVQGGDPTGTGRGDAGYTFKEPATPQTRYVRGVVAMASSARAPGVNGSQFFIVVRDYEDLYFPQQFPTETFIGVVQPGDQESFATLDRIVAVPLDGTRPKTPITVRTVTIQDIAPAG